MQFVLSLNGLQFMSLLPFMQNLFRVAMAHEIPAHSEYSLVIMANCNCSYAWKNQIEMSTYTKNARCLYVIIAVKFCMMLLYGLSNFIMILLHIAKFKVCRKTHNFQVVYLEIIQSEACSICDNFQPIPIKTNFHTTCTLLSNISAAPKST